MVFATSEARDGACLSDDDLAAFVAGELARDAADRLASHLDGCAECRRLVSAFALAERESSSDAPLVAGQVLGRFTLIRPLGQGSMGEVWAARDSELGREVALKLLHLHTASLGSGAAVRLRREAQAMARLDHPNVVAIYDLGAAAGRVFCAMRLVDGVTLRTWFAAPRRWREVLAVMIAAGRGLAAAHAAGLVHRDIKPENILIARDGRSLVTDFGLAKLAEARADDDPALRGAPAPGAGDLPLHSDETAPTVPDAREPSAPRDALVGGVPGGLAHAVTLGVPIDTPESLTRTGALVGTPAYMAPEQLSGTDADASSDQFAFCVSLHEALYGVRPFEARTVGELAAAIQQGPRRPPSARGVPARILRSLRRGLSVDRTARWPSLAALLDELERVLRRRRRRAVIAAAVAATAIAAGVLALQRTDPAELVRRASENRIAEAWSPPRAAQLRVAFYGSGSPVAGERVTSVIRAFDAYRADWLRARLDAWAATHLRHEQSAELLDRRLACFERLALALGELATVLASATAADLTRAPLAPYNLEPVASCAQAARLTAVSPPPSTPAGIEAERGLRELEALMRLGRKDEMLQRATALVEQAQRTHDPALIARARFTLGSVQAEAGKPADAEATLRQTIRDAADARDHYMVAGAWILLHAVLVNKLERNQEATAIEPAIEAAVAQAGNDPRQLADLASSRALAALDIREGSRGLDLLLEARERHVAADGPDHPSVANTDVNLGVAYAELGQLDEARKVLERAIASAHSSVGEHHPMIGRAEANLAEIAALREDWPEAARHDRAAIEVFALVYGPDALETARRRIYLARDLREQHQFAEAHALLDQARASVHRSLAPDHPERAGIDVRYAELAEAEGQMAQAEQLARGALEALRQIKATDIRIAYAITLLARIVSHRSPRDALPIYDEGLRIDVQRKSRDHHNDAQMLEEIAHVAIAAGDPEFGLRWLDRYPGAAGELKAVRAELVKAGDQRRAKHGAR